MFWALSAAPLGAAEPTPTATEAQPQETVTEWLRLGREASGAGDLDAALQYFARALGVDADNAEVHFRIGILYVRRSDYERGVHHIARSVALAPDNMGARFALASLYERGGEYAKAEELYAAIIARSRDADEVSKARANLDRLQSGRLVQSDDLQDSLRRLRQRLAASPEDVDALLQLGEVYLRMEDYSAAETAFRRVTAVQPANFLARLRLAEFAQRDADFEAAAAIAIAILQDRPTAAIGRAAVNLGENLAESLKTRGAGERAAEVLAALTVADADNAAAWGNLGVIYQQLGRHKEAENALRRAARIEPSNALIRANLAKLFLETGRPELAIKELEAVLRLGQSEEASAQASQLLLGMYTSYGNELIKRRRWGTAVKVYEKALALAPDNPQILFNLGLSHLRDKEPKLAREYFDRAAQIEPDNAKIHYHLGELFDEQDRFDDAMRAYNRALSAQPTADVGIEDVARRMSLITARRAFRDGNHNAAERILKHIIQQYPDEVATHFYLALIYEKTGRIDEAVSEYREVIRISPGHMGARLNLGRMFEQLWLEEEALAEYSIVSRSRLATGVVEEAERRLSAVSKKLNGFSYSLSQSLTFDDNVNLNEADPRFDYRSDFALGLTYHHKPNPDTRLRFTLSPMYAAYAVGAYDLLNLSLGPTLTVGTGDRGVEFGYNYSKVLSFLTENEISASQNLYGEVRRRIDPPEMFHPMSRQPGQFKPSWLLRGRLSYRKYDSITNPFLSMETYNAQLFMTIKPRTERAYTLGYGYAINDNQRSAGGDYAYQSHTVSGGVEQALAARWTANVRYSLAWYFYSNSDSFSGFTTERRNRLSSLSLSLSYVLARHVRLYGALAWVVNASNLPVGRVLTGRDLVEQNNSLGDYSSRTFTVGVGFNF